MAVRYPQQMNLLQGTALMNGTPPNNYGVFTSGYLVASLPYKRLVYPMAAIEMAQLNNGNWIGLYEYQAPSTGMGGPLSLNSKQYPDMESCLATQKTGLISRMNELLSGWDYSQENIRVFKKIIQWAEGLTVDVFGPNTEPEWFSEEEVG